MDAKFKRFAPFGLYHIKPKTRGTKAAPTRERITCVIVEGVFVITKVDNFLNV